MIAITFGVGFALFVAGTVMNNLVIQVIGIALSTLATFEKIRDYLKGK